ARRSAVVLESVADDPERVPHRGGAGALATQRTDPISPPILERLRDKNWGTTLALDAGVTCGTRSGTRTVRCRSCFVRLREELVGIDVGRIVPYIERRPAQDRPLEVVRYGRGRI
ncbi:MAG: hypothetical protein M3M96_03035, partial [Candidatus Eremiobacteraeota bacterium]|nr:hypothetical protein [Candidatus Eremiobacteraeota bacterium]